MAIGETVITLAGNLTADPELRYANDGTPWATFTVASNSKVWDKNRAEWGEGKTLFLRCTAWRWLAENATASLTKGTRVIVTGALRQFEYTAADGVSRTGFGLDAEDIAVSLRYATAAVERTPGGGKKAPGKPPAGDDPWATATPATAGVGGGGFSDEPPF